MKPRLQNLQNKKILAEILDSSLLEIGEIICNKDKFYRIKETPKTDGTMRALQVPRKKLLKIHKLIRKDLKKLPFPDYLHSGIKKKSSLSNAEAHLKSTGCLTLDIREFFPSCKKSAVKKFLMTELNQASDVADYLSEVVTVNDHIPTGSTISQMMAFFAAKKTFDEISRYATNRGLTLTVYVDDITISSNHGAVPAYVKVDIRRILAEANLLIKNKKTRLYGAQDPKRVTGVIIKDGKKEAPRELRRKLFSEIRIHEKDIKTLTPKEILRALGLLRAIRRIEGDTHPQLYHALKKFEVSSQKQVQQNNAQKKSRKTKVTSKKITLASPVFGKAADQ